MKKITFLATLLVAVQMSAQTTHNGHEYVDLGLTSNLLWATCNVGATAPEQAGDYFAWGETTPKENYSWSTYAHGSAYDQLTKYCTDAESGRDGFIDNILTLEASDDAATQNWGDDWRMPTFEELTELRAECNWEWTTDYNGTGLKGHIVSSKVEGNDNFIFLPAAGRCDGTNPNLMETEGFYWSSSLRDKYPNNAHHIKIFSESQSILICMRYTGLSVRAVVEKEKVTSALENVEFTQKIYAKDGTIYGAEDLQIFNLVGQDVTHQNGQLNNGVYLVKVGEKVQKVFVRK